MSVEAPTAIVFPGQGSQKVGMSEKIYRDYSGVREFFRQANAILEAQGWNQALTDFCLEGPRDLMELCFNGPKEVLDLSQFTQPALYVSSLAYYELLYQEKKILPQSVAGHSVGEYSALTAAGFLDFKDGVQLVAERGRLMAQVSENNPGKMAVIIGLEAAVIEEDILDKEGVYLANVNCPGQIVVSGKEEAVDLAIKIAYASGAKIAKELNVSIAAHSPLMRLAAADLREVIEAISFRQPNLNVKSLIKFYSSTAAMRVDSANKIEELLIAQLTSRVLWAKTIKQMIGDGYTHYIETGPRKVLKGLIRRIDDRVVVESAYDLIYPLG